VLHHSREATKIATAQTIAWWLSNLEVCQPRWYRWPLSRPKYLIHKKLQLGRYDDFSENCETERQSYLQGTEHIETA